MNSYKVRNNDICPNNMKMEKMSTSSFMIVLHISIFARVQFSFSPFIWYPFHGSAKEESKPFVYF